ncbi:MAG: lysophospholipid acyltransferase family protein [Spirochaetales bacterium]
MQPREALVNFVIFYLFRLLCRLDVQGMRRLPPVGPGVIITNHTSNLEGPLLYVMMRPRPTIAMAKAELWKFFATRMLMQAWKAIPLHRGRLDRQAMARSWKVLDDRKFLCIAPEGKRSKTGVLLRALPGATYFASERQVPIYPIANWGCQGIFGQLAHLRKPVVGLRVGLPFIVKRPEGGKWTSEARQAMADEMMYQLAALMPAALRGYYWDLSKTTTHYLDFKTPAHS